MLTGLLYLGAAAGLWIHRLVRPSTNEARLLREDGFKLSGVVVAGGILGPLLMLSGLDRVTALTGSLLLNLEAPLTVLIAVAAFHEPAVMPIPPANRTAIDTSTFVWSTTTRICPMRITGMSIDNKMRGRLARSLEPACFSAEFQSLAGESDDLSRGLPALMGLVA